MKKYLFPMTALFAIVLSSCKEDNEEIPYVLQQDDVKVTSSINTAHVIAGQSIEFTAQVTNEQGLSFVWTLDNDTVGTERNLKYAFNQGGDFDLVLTVRQKTVAFQYPFKIEVGFEQPGPLPQDATPYITRVLDYVPAPGQFVNTLPEYEEGDTQEDMNRKALEYIGNDNRSMITLGGYGGYVILGFDHTIQNVIGKRDFRITANAFYADANPNPDAPVGGSCEPGIVMVSLDVNKNGLADDAWYELWGSAHINPKQEAWYNMAEKNGNNVNRYFDYAITYERPTEEPTPQGMHDFPDYCNWTDNKGNKGSVKKNAFHKQHYYPDWIKENKLTFHGTCLPANYIDESGQGTYYVGYKFAYGYVDNELNTKDDACFDISWARNSKGQKVRLPGVDFIKIYNGTNQYAGWLGEISTEVTGAYDLHLTNEEIKTIEN